MKKTAIFVCIVVLLTLVPQGPAEAAATLLPNGEQCFSATSATSGGTLGPIVTLGAISAGAAYVNGTYTNVPLTGGNGFGALATITVAGNIVSNVSVTNAGSHYAAGDTLSASNANLGGAGAGFSVPVNGVSTTGTGMVGLLGTITGGSAGTAGTYGGVALTGGSGSGATANITVSGGAVTAVTILNPGSQYVVGDTLSAASGNIGNVSGFSVPVSSVAINSSLAGGSVAMYVPSTTTFKQTWFNSDQASTHQNTNPVNLDANGCAIIYGTGSYRQVLKDSLGNTIWDQVTTDTSANNNTFWAGLAGGTPNAITVTDAGFNSTDGSVIQFVPISTNTAATTLTPSGTGVPISIVKDTATGAVALQGGEIVAGSPSNVVSVVYSATQANFHLLNLVNQAAATTAQTLCGGVGLKIVNAASPNSQMTITADQTTAFSSSSQTISRLNVSYTLNITNGTVTSAANGMDGESPGTSAWLYVWIIDNGSQGASLASLSATAPTLPSGYTYKCRVGALRVDGSGNLMRTLQLGNHVQYVVTPATNTAGAVAIINGQGTSTNCGTGAPTWESISISSAVPVTATWGDFILWGNYNGGGALTLVLLAPNGNYGGTGTGTSNPGFTGEQNGTFGVPLNTRMMLETAQTAFYCGGGANASLWVTGWTDKVNAN